MALPASDVESAAMSFCWLFPASGDPPAFAGASFCPSCHQKRVVEFGEWLCEEVIKAVPHRHLIFSLPKMLRRYFLYDRKLLTELGRCAWETLKIFLKEIDPGEGVVPGAVIVI